jgi:hypothetical protein
LFQEDPRFRLTAGLYFLTFPFHFVSAVEVAYHHAQDVKCDQHGHRVVNFDVPLCFHHNVFAFIWIPTVSRTVTSLAESELFYQVFPVRLKHDDLTKWKV